MCGRFAFHLTYTELIGIFKLVGCIEFTPRYNVAPTQQVVVIIAAEKPAGLMGVGMKWGLIPSWSKDTKMAGAMINARGETVAEKPAFRAAFKRRRCIIPVSGFYEWQKLDAKNKQPYYMTPAQEKVFRFAGLWEQWTSPEGEVIQSCTIITTTSNHKLEFLHDRMPVILDEEGMEVWLDHGIEDPKVLQSLIVPADEKSIQQQPVAPLVNSVKNEGATLIAPLSDSP
jgi:putative SOS response-associated peptidase YedK